MSGREALLQALRRQLECPVCMEIMRAPIAQCIEGHSLCSRCRKRLHRCPECRRAFSSTRCRSLEGISELVSERAEGLAGVHCRRSRPTFPSPELVERYCHRATCPKQRCVCQVCGRYFPLRDLAIHVGYVHPDRLLRTLRLSSIETLDSCYLVKQNSVPFWIKKTTDGSSLFLHAQGVSLSSVFKLKLHLSEAICAGRREIRSPEIRSPEVETIFRQQDRAGNIAERSRAGVVALQWLIMCSLILFSFCCGVLSVARLSKS